MDSLRELDIRIASEVMGLRPCHFTQEARWSAWATSWRCRCATNEKCYPENESAIEHPHSPLARYSTRLDAAWEVLTGARSRFVFTRMLSSNGGEDFRLCRDYPNQDTYWVDWMAPGGLRRGPDAKTPELAICLAALDAVEASRPAKAQA